jgi:mannitol-1-phosphate 5-dehydrogenase
LAENHPKPATAVREALLEGANEKERGLIDGNLGIAQAQVLRSCIEPTNQQHPLTIQVQDHWTLPLDGDALRTKIQIDGFELKPNFERELTRKLFTYNCVNAMVCYIGHLAGYKWLADAANNPMIAELALKAGRESSAALVAAYGFDAEEQQMWCNQALAKYQDETIRDPIERNARDPIRKLGRFERLSGPIHLCIEQNLPHQTLLIGVAAALRYPGASMAETLPTGEAEARLESLLASESI